MLQWCFVEIAAILMSAGFYCQDLFMTNREDAE